MGTNFEGLQELSRLKSTRELGRFIEVDNHEAVRTGDLEKNLEAIKKVGSNFDRELPPGAAVREGVDELTLRRGEEGMLRFFVNTGAVETVGGGHWLWTKTGTQFVKPSTRV